MTVAHFILIYLSCKSSPSPVHCFHQLKLCVSDDEALHLRNALTFAVSCNGNGWSWRSGKCAKCRHVSRQWQLDNLLFSGGNIGGYTVTCVSGCAESIGFQNQRVILWALLSTWFYHIWFWITVCGRSQPCLCRWQKLRVWRWSGALKRVQSQVLEDCLSYHVMGRMFGSVADVCLWAGSWGELTSWHGRCGPVWCICLCDRIKLKSLVRRYASACMILGAARHSWLTDSGTPCDLWSATLVSAELFCHVGSHSNKAMSSLFCECVRRRWYWRSCGWCDVERWWEEQ